MLQAALISEEVAERQTSLADITKQVLRPLLTDAAQHKPHAACIHSN